MAKDGKSPAFQFYPKDFYSDERVMLMTYEQQGIYIKLLSHQWEHGSIPDSEEEIGKILGFFGKISLKRLRLLLPQIIVCFETKQGETGRLANARMERDRAAREEFRTRQAENGRLGGRPRLYPNTTQSKPSGKPKQNQTVNSGLTQTKAKKTSASASLDADVITSSVTTSRARETESNIGSFESNGEETRGNGAVDRPALANAARKPNPKLGPYRVLADEPEYCVIEFASGERRLWVDSEIGWSILHRPEATP